MRWVVAILGCMFAIYTLEEAPTDMVWPALTISAVMILAAAIWREGDD